MEFREWTHTLERPAGANAGEEIHGDARQHRQHGRHDQERRDQQREGELAGEDETTQHAHPAAAIVVPANERASARIAQATSPRPTESAAAMARSAASVNSV